MDKCIVVTGAGSGLGRAIARRLAAEGNTIILLGRTLSKVEVVALPHAMFALYQSSKAGLERFTEALHVEPQPDGIRVTLARAGQMMR